jgi:hypothetical protein
MGPKGFEAVASSFAASNPAEGRVDRHVIAEMWTGARLLGALRQDEPEPTDQQLAEAAARLTGENGGVPPTVRTVEVAFGPSSVGHVQPYGGNAA